MRNYCFHFGKFRQGLGWNFPEASRNLSPPEILIDYLPASGAFLAVTVVQ
jgi:hypothetical protein